MKWFNRLMPAMSILLICLIFGNVIILYKMKQMTEAVLNIQEWMSLVLAGFTVLIVLIHFCGLGNLVTQFNYFRNVKFLRSFVFVIGVLSLFFLAVDVVMLKEIGNEYKYNHDISGEWNIVFGGYCVHVFFSVLLLIQCVRDKREYAVYSELNHAAKDESLFLTANQIGVISAATGFVCLFLLNRSTVPSAHFSGLSFILFVVFMTPYGITALYWFFTKRREKLGTWYDEKQFADVSQGAFGTLVFTVFISIAFYFLFSCECININMSIWFPSYLFMTLLIFSGSVLYLSKVSD